MVVGSSPVGYDELDNNFDNKNTVGKEYIDEYSNKQIFEGYKKTIKSYVIGDLNIDDIKNKAINLRSISKNQNNINISDGYHRIVYMAESGKIKHNYDMIINNINQINDILTNNKYYIMTKNGNIVVSKYDNKYLNNITNKEISEINLDKIEKKKNQIDDVIINIRINYNINYLMNSER